MALKVNISRLKSQKDIEGAMKSIADEISRLEAEIKAANDLKKQVEERKRALIGEAAAKHISMPEDSTMTYDEYVKKMFEDAAAYRALLEKQAAKVEKSDSINDSSAVRPVNNRPMV